MIRALLTALLLASPAAADVRAADAARLAAFDRHFGSALRAALRDGATGDVGVLTDALSGTPVKGAVGTGDWNCRTMKMGIYGLTVYRNFRCQIRQLSDTTFELEKLTGSQRSIGTLTLEDGRTLYTGVGFVDGGPAVRYAELPAEQRAVGPGQTIPQVGIFEQISDSKARLMLPAPLLESQFDILYLTR